MSEVKSKSQVTFADIRNIIEQRLQVITNQEEELKVKREMINDRLANDPEIEQLESQIKDLRKQLKSRKEYLMESDGLLELVEESNALKEDKRSLGIALSAELLQYHTTAKTLEFKDHSGKLYRINFKGSLKETDQPSLFTETELESASE